MSPVRTWPLCAALLALTVAAYLPLWDNEFVDFDDEPYITANRNVTAGISARGFAWAWRTLHGVYWQPVSWLSLQLDAQLFSAYSLTGEAIPSPAAFHGQNLFWHAASALMLFGLLQRLTGGRWRSFLVAALFAVHPLHVESVAWAAERKDVLSVFFGLLTVWAYAGYAAAPGRLRYAALAGAFTLSLLSKPMLVTLPFVLLLLDYWPLPRLRPGAAPAISPGRLVLEKVPLFVLAAAVGIITHVGRERSGMVTSLDVLPLSARLANAATAYGWYVSHTVYPRGLAILYPHPYGNWSVLPALAGAGTLLAVTLLALWQRRRRPWLVVGWLWFLVTLVPVIGLVQGGEQAWADRFTYWPHVGLFVAVAWGLAEVVERLRVPAGVSGAAAALGLGGLAVLTSNQVGYWHDSVTLWERALAVTEDNSVAHLRRGHYCLRHGRPDLAERHCSEAVRISPSSPHVRYFLGQSLLALGKDEEAAEQFRRTLQLRNTPRAAHALLRGDPTSADVWQNLGVAQLRQGKPVLALHSFRKVLERQPASADALAGLGHALWRSGERQEAVQSFQAALERNPGSADAWNGLGVAHLTRGELDEASAAFSRAARLNPGMVSAFSNLGVALGRRGRWADAVACHLAAVEMQEQGEKLLRSMNGRPPTTEGVPQLVIYQCRLAFALDHLGDHRKAAVVYRAALQRDPEWPAKFTAKARALATDADDNFRDPRLAHELATQAAQAFSHPSAVETPRTQSLHLHQHLSEQGN
ncbi:MAG TPA: tetratricopeptide repeat protein [Gemmataceae bacterium]|nr:tetratricopeptide repeat protein [Gemmataceae bacterium]